MHRGRLIKRNLPLQPWYLERHPAAHIRTANSAINQTNMIGSWIYKSCSTKLLEFLCFFGAFIILIDKCLLFNFLWHIRSTDDAYQNRMLFHQICLMVSDHYYTLILLRRIIAQMPKLQFYLKDFHNKIWITVVFLKNYF